MFRNIILSMLLTIGLPFSTIAEEPTKADHALQVPYSLLMDYQLSLDELKQYRRALEHIQRLLNLPLDPGQAQIEMEALLNEDKFNLTLIASMAVIAHNADDYVKSIRYVNHYTIYKKQNLHQLHYLLADNYLKIGDYKNAYHSFHKAEQLYQEYINSGPDLKDALGIKNYFEKVNALKNEFENSTGPDFKPCSITVEVPEPGDVFWAYAPPVKFPRAALRKGRNGYAIINFDLTAAGNPINPQIIETSRSIFNKPTNKFIETFKYIPYSLFAIPEEIVATNVNYRLEYKFEN
ncbi:energy transducer TonB [Pseudemcibacter aquimaris]|uniref:energy transducer TonB n=1 Tax=Pseudemcibacter aquimaris TaxID=2857064 RepID=UPI002012B521|nr:energy transducer TonB [Pseudemcibacter aquimaris]MCC3861072.1 energy transducer TonB [Pseudemcibacter aquimaris]WDU59890.1 energy transducer TonB [Pseudemcibacter aquimaris]